MLWGWLGVFVFGLFLIKVHKSHVLGYKDPYGEKSLISGQFFSVQVTSNITIHTCNILYLPLCCVSFVRK